MHLLALAFLSLGQQRRQIPIAIVELHRQMTVVHFPSDRALAGLQHDLRHLRDRDERSAARREHQIGDGFRAIARCWGKANRGVVMPLTDEDLAHGLATDARSDQV